VSDFLADTTALLARTPEVLRALLIGLPDAWTDTPDTADGWRPRDVVGHLITGEEANWTVRARRILEEGTGRPFDRFERFSPSWWSGSPPCEPPTSRSWPSSPRMRISTGEVCTPRSGR
jgi:hypothetical protein